MQPGSNIGAAAATLASSRLSGGMLADLPVGFRPRDEVEGYEVQHALHGILTSAGYGVRAGWKIGCTTKTMQTYLGVDGPSAGGMFLAQLWRGSHLFAVPKPRRLGVECEVAVRLARDLPRRERAYDVADMAPSVAACMAAIEVVEDRYTDYPSLGVPTLIADDFFHYAAVLGPEDERFDPARLRDVTGSLRINNVEVASGRGVDILGEPLAALCWLANRAVEWGEPLRAGEVVLLGSVVQTQWVEPGDVVTISNDLLGEAGVAFEEARPVGS
ncbi:MAG TPA: fumarylacetoacetate hydrolase family protein [Acidimicrobiales bacterium]|nr:fumarylacetoacetate hydrolase family protein [Acidimicrobiales bacterium]